MALKKYTKAESYEAVENEEGKKLTSLADADKAEEESKGVKPPADKA